MENMILIMVDECGDEVEIDRFTLQMDLDEDELEIWKDRKIDKASKQFPEARGFYFEDRRGWGRMIARMIHEEGGYFLDPDDEDDALELGIWEWWEGWGEIPAPTNRQKERGKTMERTYLKQFFGTIEATEKAVKVFDQIFRARYNVHGGHREASYKTPDGEYTVIMSYTANWMDSPRMQYLFPEYTAKGIERTFNHVTRDLPDTDEWYFYCDMIKEIPDLEAWRSGEC